MECGCRIDYDDQPPHERGDLIIHCPKHAHVDRFVEALERIKTQCGQFTGGVFNVQGISFLAQDALAALEPEEPVDEPDTSPVGPDGSC